MVLKSDQQRIKTLLQEAIPLLCKNGLSYQSEFCIEALIGITLDHNDVFLVNINERVCSADNSTTSDFHEDRQMVCGGRGDAESVDLSDSGGNGNSKIKTAEQYRIASGRAFHKQTIPHTNKSHAHGSSMDICESKSFQRCYNDTKSSERQQVNETEADIDFADSYGAPVDSDLGSPPRKKQMCEWGNEAQTYIKQEPDIFEIIDQSDTELEDDVKDPETISIPATSEATVISTADIYNIYSADLDILQAPSTMPSTAPSGSNTMATFGSNLLNHSLSLAQALPELSVTSPSVTNQSAVGYGLPSFPSNQSKIIDCTSSPATPGNADHYTDYQGAAAEDATNSTMFACDLCSGVFKCQRNLNDHIRGKHLARQTYRCVMCGQSFRWRSALSNHRKRWCRFMAHEHTQSHQTVTQVSHPDTLLSMGRDRMVTTATSGHTSEAS